MTNNPVQQIENSILADRMSELDDRLIELRKAVSTKTKREYIEDATDGVLGAATRAELDDAAQIIIGRLCTLIDNSCAFGLTRLERIYLLEVVSCIENIVERACERL